MTRIETSISEQSLDIAGAMGRAGAHEAGAIAAFVGTVRVDSSVDANQDRSVQELFYEAHPELASAKMEEIALSISERFELTSFIAHHRTGSCPLGEPTVVVVCAAPHRAEALAACHAGIDEIKQSVPIWKKEIYSDGSSWVGTGG